MKYSALVLTLLAIPAAHAAETGSEIPWYLDSTFVAFLALLTFLAIAAKMGAFKAIFSGLDNRAAGIQNQIDEAKKLREEAAQLMAKAERKTREADEAAQDIIKRAKADAAAMMKQAKLDLEAKVTRREAQAEQRITRAEADAASDVRRAAADAATKAARDILSGSQQADDLFDKALKEIDERLN